jgi:hypothetical protein
MRRSFLARFAPFAAAVAALSALPLGCATGLSSARDGVGGEGGEGATTAGPTTVTASSTTGGGNCDGTGECATCRTCAVAGECAKQFDTCSGDQECLDYNACIEPCATGDDACFDACSAQYPFGEQEFFEYAFCLICTACYTDCEGTATACKS